MKSGTMGSSQPRFGQFLRGVFGTKGRSILEVVEGVMPSIDLTAPIKDLLAFRGEYMVCGEFDGTSAAAQFPTVWLGTLDNSILVVETLLIQATTAQRIRVRSIAGQALPAASLGVTYGDKRVGSSPRTSAAGKFTSEAALLAGGPVARFNVAAGVPQLIPCNTIVTGSRGVDKLPVVLYVQGETANTELLVSYLGYTRTLEDSELTP